MRSLTPLLFVGLANLLPCAAFTAAQTTPLKPTEAATGWLRLFDGETTFGWRLESGEIKAADGALVLGGAKETKVFLPIVGFGEGSWTYRYVGEGKPSFTLQAMRGGEAVATGDLHLARVMEKGESQWITGAWTIKPEPAGGVGVSGQTTVVGASRTEAAVFSLDAGCLAVGHLSVPAGVQLFLKDVKFKPTGLEPIFNGKDLTGWKEIPGRKSKFTVTPEGWLNVKDGNGDLQTEGQWDDFILQMDVISNGKHLNSGIFFRCLPGEFWSGYEAQIRNQWQGDDRNKPVDYGTGGIYNRQPARRVVSSDNEWFTLTVLAHGNRLATWVNGYQVADFTDTRPPHRSARNGQKLDKGPISIQGHDATTDLSFKNVRIVGLPR